MQKILLENEFGRVEQFELSNGLQAIRFMHQKGKGSVSLYGGQVLNWQPNAQQPVFWLSNTSHFSKTKAIRGGVPLCWPWFGGEVKLANGEQSKVSNHGFARQSEWQITDLSMSGAAVEIILSLRGEAYSEHWPYAFELTQKLIFGETFQQTLTMANLSDQTVEYTGALHSYFCVGDPEKTEIPSLAEAFYDDKISGISEQKSALENCKGPIDRIYHSNNNMRIIDHKWQRQIAVQSQGCQQWVLWNPGREAETMKDLHSQGENEFVCLEAANTDGQPIEAKSSVSISQTITLYAL